jgi:signal transduction histidine kinase
MAESRGLLHKITRAFLLQGLLIAVAAVLGVFFSKIVIEEILIKNAILEEDAYFRQQYATNPGFGLPDTKNLTIYLDSASLPDYILEDFPKDKGFHEYGSGNQGTVLYISDRDDLLTYLLYYRGQVDALVLYYGIFPLFTVLLILYLSLWLTYRFSRRTVSPLVRLARNINQIDYNQPDFSHLADEHDALDIDSEIATLLDALNKMGNRLNSYIARERNFTRDASHELRSPITVINIAADMLLSEQELPPLAFKSVLRIKRAVNDMEQLTDIFLLLAREDDNALTRDQVILNDVVAEEIELANILKRDKQLSIHFEPYSRLEVYASDKVLSVLLGNLIRNAINYTEQGKVNVRIRGRQVEIEDSGEGISEQQIGTMFKPFTRGENTSAAGFGIGLTIVKRLSERFGWPIDVESNPGEGTRFVVSFPQAKILQEPEVS